MPGLPALAFMLALLCTQPASAQGLFWDSLGVLPGTITRIGHANLKALRKMPHFSLLRKTYGGTPSRDLDRWLGAFGLNEEDVTEVLVGLEGIKNGTHIFVIASGEFYLTLPTAPGTAESHLAPTKIGDFAGYCERGSCALFRGQNWAALGTKQFLSYVVGGGDGVTEPLSSEGIFAELAATIPRDAPVWGFAQGATAAQWFRTVLPFSDPVPIVWSTVLNGLEGLTYSVTPDDEQLRISVDLQYKASAGASLMGTALTGVKVIASVLWRQEHPGLANPFSDAQVGVDDRSVSLALSASYDVLENGPPLGPRHQS